jgi:energy-coupling factor transporter ATP-binding protein EcfA2
MLEELRSFLNVASETDWILAISWLVSALNGIGPFPILVVAGEQGSGKSTFCRLLRSLVDPAIASICGLPKDERDLIISAVNQYCLVFDNLSKVEPWLADAFCRLATNGGFATRMLHTDRGQLTFYGSRPIILNGITAVAAERADLADRSLMIRLTTIPETERRSEAEFWQAWEEVRPRMLGALLDGVSAGLRNLGAVKLERSPRMADFAHLMVAASPGLGWDEQTFLTAYGANRRDIADTAFEADLISIAIDSLLGGDVGYTWTGTASALLEALNLLASETTQKSRSWPQTAQALGNRIERIAPMLRARGIEVERKHSGVRIITVWRKNGSKSPIGEQC